MELPVGLVGRMVTLIFCLVVYVAAGRFRLFFYWKTYWLLWRALLQNSTPEIGFKVRLRQAVFLIKYLVLPPWWTFLWFLDNHLYSAHRTIRVRQVFIVGLPRSGTHRSLAADDCNFSAIRHLEWRYA